MVLHPSGYQANRGPLPGLGWKKDDQGRMTYWFTDAYAHQIEMREMAAVDEERLMILNASPHLASGVMTLNRDMAYWISVALLNFANTGKLP